ncbi:hypothetical protein AgCh_025832 [Apium graveolens]
MVREEKLEMTEECPQLGNIKVSNLMKMGEMDWDVDLLSDLFCPRDIALIKRIPIPMVDESDSWYWLPDERAVTKAPLRPAPQSPENISTSGLMGEKCREVEEKR